VYKIQCNFESGSVKFSVILKTHLATLTPPHLGPPQYCVEETKNRRLVGARPYAEASAKDARRCISRCIKDQRDRVAPCRSVVFAQLGGSCRRYLTSASSLDGLASLQRANEHEGVAYYEVLAKCPKQKALVSELDTSERFSLLGLLCSRLRMSIFEIFLLVLVLTLFWNKSVNLDCYFYLYFEPNRSKWPMKVYLYVFLERRDDADDQQIEEASRPIGGGSNNGDQGHGPPGVMPPGLETPPNSEKEETVEPDSSSNTEPETPVKETEQNRQQQFGANQRAKDSITNGALQYQNFGGQPNTVETRPFPVQPQANGCCALPQVYLFLKLNINRPGNYNITGKNIAKYFRFEILS